MSKKFRIFVSVILALIAREAATRFGRSFGGYVWAIIEPTLIIVTLGYIFNLYLEDPPLGTSFALFYSTGLVPYVIFSEIATQTGNALVQNKPLLNFRSVTPIDTIIARFILSLFTLTVVSAAVLAFVLSVVDEPLNVAWLTLLIGLSSAALLGLSIGSLNAVLFTVVPTWRNIWNIAHRPLFLISGTFFLYDTLMPDLQSILFWNPLIHSVSMTRQGMYAMYYPDWVSPVFLFGFSITFLLVGFAGLASLRNRVLEIL